jgi:uncharacterized repeat protein (TIGR03806 family)
VQGPVVDRHARLGVAESHGETTVTRGPARLRLAVLGVCLALALPALVSAFVVRSAVPTPEPIGAFLDGVFPSKTPPTSSGPGWTTQNALPNLTFEEPVRIVPHPRTNELAIVEKGGKVWLVDNDPAASRKTLMLDLGPQLQVIQVGSGGMAGLVFHPEFGQAGSPNRGFFYVFYRWSPTPGLVPEPTTPGYNRLSRFNVPDGAVRADLSSEYALIQQFDRVLAHPGGDMFFDDEGLLYLSVGEEGIADKTRDTQRIDLGLFSGLLRLDVDRDASRSHPIRRQPHGTAEPPPGWPKSFTQGYYIPNDNPFVGSGGAIAKFASLEEFYAIGFRHPWTVSRDPQTGIVWVADVGATEREEINQAVRGGNYQWAYKEGTVDGDHPRPDKVIGTEYGPFFEYDHDTGQAIIGVGVYRGSRFPELSEKYLFSDFMNGKLWTLEPNEGNAPIVTKIADLPSGYQSGINSYAIDREGRILLAKTAGGLAPGGTILELVRETTPAPQPPALLSEVGAFAQLSQLQIRSGCIPYSLNVLFWSDGALKKRWLCLPNDGTHDTPAEQIGFSEEADWTFPVGTVLIKHFEIAVGVRNAPSATRRLETRFIVHAEDGYYGVTYRWLPDGSDAVLLFDGEDEELSVVTPGVRQLQVWHYPGRTECLQCHNANAGGVLGPKTRQLNRDQFYPRTRAGANQLSVLNQLGALAPPLDESEIPAFLTMARSDDPVASLETRARSYLDSNCSHCHRPGGVRANFDARLTTPLSRQRLIGGTLNEPLGIPGEAVIVPGSLEQSVLYRRASSLDSLGMPPLAKNVVDATGVALLAEWILALGNGNRTPEIENPGAQTDREGAQVALDILATDPDDDVLTFGALGLPPGLPVNVSTGTISGTLAAGSAGDYLVTVTASDGIISASVEVTWTVQPPALAVPRPRLWRLRM